MKLTQRSTPAVLKSAMLAALMFHTMACSSNDSSSDSRSSTGDAAEPAGDSQGGGGGDSRFLNDGLSGGGDGPIVNEPACAPPSDFNVTVEELVSGHSFDKPIFMAQAPGDGTRYYVAEKTGSIRLVLNGSVLQDAFLSLSVDLTHRERGLLGLAFHPNYQSNGRFFVYYTPTGAQQNVVGEFHRSAGDENVADATEVKRWMTIDDPQKNHNGGMIAFGPDGHLYIGTGDGGGGGDDEPGHGDIGNGLNTNVLLGKILRLDVDGASPIPANNPFVGGGGSGEVWAYGLRNPWRFSFDRERGDLYIADVGQNKWEEISVTAAGTAAPQNYGWAAFEGNENFRWDEIRPKLPGQQFAHPHATPVYVYAHGSQDLPMRNGCSISGGYVYRGAAIPSMKGSYLFGDVCSDDVVALRWCNGSLQGTQRIAGLSNKGNELSSFGEDNAGELYIVFHGSGEVFKIIPGS